MINLELRKVGKRNPRVGDKIEIEIFAVSDSDEKQFVGALHVLFSWNPVVLELLGNHDIRAPKWNSSDFKQDPWRVNEHEIPTDGDAMYVAWSKINSKVRATPKGRRMTTLVFEALSMDTTEVRIIKSILKRPMPLLPTKVFDYWIPNGDVTGTLGPPAEVTIRRAKG